MSKVFLSVISIISLAACNIYKPITVKLHPTGGYEKNLGLARYITSNVDPGRTEKELAEKLELNPFCVALFDHCPPGLQNDSFDSRTEFLLGQRGDSIIIIADQNNNNRLDDDKITAVHKNILQSQSASDLRKLPNVKIDNLQAFCDGKKYSFSTSLFLFPDSIRTGQLTLSLVSNEKQTGQFKYRGEKYRITARQVSSGQFSTDARYVNILIDQKKKNRNDDYDEDYLLHLYDTVKIAGHVFVIENFSPLVDSITLHPLKPSLFPSWSGNVKRAAENLVTADFIGNRYPYSNYYLDSAEFISMGKYQALFMNFWFANCAPCIAEFKSLNILYEKYKNNPSFKFISLTFESPQEIERIKRKYSLTFNIYSLPRAEIAKLSLTNLFPTNILIDEDGVVEELYIGGETNALEVDHFFDKTIIPKISQLLNPSQRVL